MMFDNPFWHMRIWPPSPCQVVDTNKERIAWNNEWKKSGV